jgi:chemotaxis protein CheC
LVELSPLNNDTLKEILNIGVGKSADILNSMLGSHIKLNVPEVKIVTELKHEMFPDIYKDYAIVNLPFKGEISGTAKMLFPSEGALKMVKLLTGDDTEDFDAVKIEALSEIGNIILNSVMGMFSNTLKTDLEYSLPWFQEIDINNLVSIQENVAFFLLARVSFIVEKLDIQGEIIILFRMGSFENLDRLIKNIFK